MIFKPVYLDLTLKADPPTFMFMKVMTSRDLTLKLYPKCEASGEEKKEKEENEAPTGAGAPETRKWPGAWGMPSPAIVE